MSEPVITQEMKESMCVIYDVAEKAIESAQCNDWDRFYDNVFMLRIFSSSLYNDMKS